MSDDANNVPTFLRIPDSPKRTVEMPTREEMDAAAKRFIDPLDAKDKTIQEQSMDWAREMTSKVAADKERAVVEALIVAMLSAGLTHIAIEPRHALMARDYTLHRHTDPMTGDFLIALTKKGS